MPPLELELEDEATPELELVPMPELEEEVLAPELELELIPALELELDPGGSGCELLAGNLSSGTLLPAMGEMLTRTTPSMALGA